MEYEIPQGLRDDVKLTATETALLGPITAFQTAANVAGIAVWWSYLLGRYAAYHEKELDQTEAKNICTTALLGMGGYYTGCKTATGLFCLIPNAGQLAKMDSSALQNMIFTYQFAVALSGVFSVGYADTDDLAQSIKYMFSKNNRGHFLSVVDIVDLYWDYMTGEAFVRKGIKTSAGKTTAGKTGTQKYLNVEIRRNGEKKQGAVCLRQMNGKPCMDIGGVVIFPADIVRFGERLKDGKTYLEVRTQFNEFLVGMPEAEQDQILKSLPALPSPPPKPKTPPVEPAKPKATPAEPAKPKATPAEPAKPKATPAKPAKTKTPTKPPVNKGGDVVDIIRNGEKKQGRVSMEQENGKPVLKIAGDVVKQEEILYFGEQEEKGTMYLEILSLTDSYLIDLPEDRRNRWLKALEAGTWTDEGASTGTGKKPRCAGARIIRNGEEKKGDVSLDEQNGNPVLKIAGEVVKVEEILYFGEQEEKGKLYLEILSMSDSFLIEMTKDLLDQWLKALESSR